MYETEDPNQFMQFMENLIALGGGDEPEMCLTAVQVDLGHYSASDGVTTCSSSYSLRSAGGAHAQSTPVRDLCVH